MFKCNLLNEYFNGKTVSKTKLYGLSEFVTGVNPKYFNHFNILHYIAQKMPNELELFDFMVTNSSADINTIVANDNRNSVLGYAVNKYYESTNVELVDFILNHPKFIKDSVIINAALKIIHLENLCIITTKKDHKEYERRMKVYDLLISHGGIISYINLMQNIPYMKGDDRIKYVNIYLSQTAVNINSLVQSLCTYYNKHVTDLTKYLDNIKDIINKHPGMNLNIFHEHNLKILIELCGLNHIGFMKFLEEKGLDIKNIRFFNHPLSSYMTNNASKDVLYSSYGFDKDSLDKLLALI